MKEESVEMPVAEFRKDLADVINAAAARGRTTYITNRGRRIAAMVPLEVAEQAEEEK
jgi:prevent-host-death family protein